MNIFEDQSRHKVNEEYGNRIGISNQVNGELDELFL